MKPLALSSDITLPPHTLCSVTPGTFTGNGYVGSDLRHYDGIMQIGAFELGNAKHAEFVAYYDYAI